MPNTKETSTILPTTNKNCRAAVLVSMHAQSCTICREDDKSSSEMLRLTSCGHESCKECMVQWIQKEEESFCLAVVNNDQSTTTTSDASATPAPTCPFCRIDIAENDTLAILGRPFQPKILQKQQEEQGAERQEEIVIDELTLDWLREHSRACPTCGVYIEKVEGGCDKMECLCGCRFCFACGAPNAQCDCTPATHHFWDNHRNIASLRDSSPALAPRDDETGLVDIRRHIEERAKRDHMARVRRERSRRKYEVEWEARERWGSGYDVGVVASNLSTWNGTWLFCSSSHIGSMKVLEAQNKRYWYQKNALQEEIKRTQLDCMISSGHFIFNNSTPATMSRRLETLVRHQERAFEVQRLRKSKKLHDVSRNEDLSADWLFKTPTRRANYVLQQQICGRKVARLRRLEKRRRMQSEDEEEELLLASLSRNQNNNIDNVLSNGQWLFVKKKTQHGTHELLNRLVKHQLIAWKKRLDQFEEEQDSYNSDSDWSTCCSSDNNGDEAENAMNIRLLFLEDETEKPIFTASDC